MNNALTIAFAPHLPHIYLYMLCAVTAIFLLLSLFYHRRGILTRTLCAAAFILLLLNPSIIKEKREAVSDVGVIVADRSPSQNYGERTAKTDAALAFLKENLEKIPGMETRVVNAASGLQQETRLFSDIDEALSDIPASRRAGVIVITDGQVHDVPQDSERLGDYGPISALITADRKERDRQMVIVEAPSYGIVGQNVTVRLRVEDSNADAGDTATVFLQQDSNESQPQVISVPVNQDATFQTTLDHAGQNVFNIETPPLEGELTAANNRVPLIINGVRDRLRVLLVSGQPHAGGRTWRDMLTSDPGVDLVHFTILREPNKLDTTPQSELSLIAFPFQELFEIKLYDFDLIIFDRYRLNRILPNYYFDNIARYVKEGGALLEASGPDFAAENSIYETGLRQVLPAAPTGEIVERPFKPVLTEKGARHPVTENLNWPGGTPDAPGWGRWLRQVGVTPSHGETLMNGADSLPLLILDRVGKGRVAQLASDEIWLWSRGFEGGGPQAELLRRLAHWLMKEPELEENALDVSVEGTTIWIRRRAMTDDPVQVKITAPDGTESTEALLPAGMGQFETHVNAAQLGIYIVDDGEHKRFALVGSINPPELRGVLGTEEKMAPAVNESRGGMLWLADTARPDVRVLPPGRRYGGNDWIGLRSNHSYNVTGVQSIPLLPEWLYALSLLLLVIGCWWIEGGRKE